MALIKTITNDHEFAEWLQKSHSYSNSFTIEGADALQKYIDEDLSYGTEIEFDPVAWCCEYSEYKTAKEACAEYLLNASDELEALELLKDNTTVIKFDGGIIVQGF